MKYVLKENKHVNKKELENISKALDIDINIVKILYDRGYDSLGKIEEFLSDDLNLCHNPLLLPDILKAKSRIEKALENDEKIVIWGDYDVDGICASTILYLAFRDYANKHVSIYIPDRQTEGYGLSEKGVKKIIDKNVDLLITVDCGIAEKLNIDTLERNNVDVIVTDHHEVQKDKYPNCLAVVNMKREDNKYPFRELCGASVALKLVEVLFGKEAFKKYIDLAAFATVTDVVPLVDENRIILKNGLKKMNSNDTLLAFKVLKKKLLNKGEKVTAETFGFSFGPLLNATGRLKTAKIAVAFLINEDINRANLLAEYMIHLNDYRKDLVDKIYNFSLKQVAKFKNDNVIIIKGSYLEQGVLGIVSSRLTEEFHKPSIVLTYDPDTAIFTGSARSIEGVSMYDALYSNRRYLHHWGGHKMAAGLSIKAKDYINFENGVVNYFNSLDEKLFVPKIEYDLNFDLDDIDKDLIKDLNLIEPCGMSNPKVRFRSKGEVKYSKKIGKNKTHFNGRIRGDEKDFQMVGFKQEPAIGNIDFIYEAGINHFRGKSNIQLNVLDYQKPTFTLDDYKFNEFKNDFSLDLIKVNSRKKKQFASANIYSVLDLLRYYPIRYEDYRNPKTVREFEDKDKVSVIAKVIDKGFFRTNNGFWLNCLDPEGNFFSALFFNQTWQYNFIHIDATYFLIGKVSINNYGKSLAVESFNKDLKQNKCIVPIYRKIKGMSFDYLNKKIDLALSLLEAKDVLSKEIIEKYDLIPETEALKKIHRPKEFKDIKESRERLVFDRLLEFSFKLNKQEDEKNRKSFDKSDFYRLKNKDLVEDFIENKIAFTLTKDQEKAIKSIYKSFNQERSNILIQGDVGSGKTIVAFLAMVLAINNNTQSALVAPTEVLANQHFKKMQNLVKDTKINIELLTSSTTKKEKARIKEGISNGNIDMVISTHALFQDDVKFKDLACLVIDEQHKFGVKQREKLYKDSKTHLITMSATPIPRSLAATLLGESIKIIRIQEKPKGRGEVETIRMDNDREINKLLEQELEKGHQVFVVCPWIGEVEKSEVKDSFKDVSSVKDTTIALKEYFEPKYKVAAIHGDLKSKDIKKTLDAFKENKINILVSTTIVEVGIDIKNVTVMLLKNSERFGLAQAHQLRGRVGRGKAKSYTILETYPGEKKAKILESTDDGFIIAKEDLKLRGIGNFLGVEQHGDDFDSNLVINNLALFTDINEMVLSFNKDKRKFYLDLINKNK